MKEPAGFWDRLRSGLATATGKQCGFNRVPQGEELGGTSLTMPYFILIPIIETAREESMNDPHDSSDIVIQMKALGLDPRQARWMSNRVFEAITDKDQGGNYVHALVLGSDSLEWRLCDQRGAILPSGPTLFEEQDNYRLRRGA